MDRLENVVRIGITKLIRMISTADTINEIAHIKIDSQIDDFSYFGQNAF